MSARLAALVLVALLGFAACTRAQAEQGAKDVRDGLNAYCDARERAANVFGFGGMAGAAGGAP